MPTSLNVIALISGGKDSFFSILHCLANGHRLVALANLHPPEGGDEDINSFMYQTVGSSLISLYGQALDVPLYRQEIRGSAVIHDRDYRQQQDDETEDLVPLLKQVMQHHPEANAVSTGAILSTYQRTRVENVALRLGLTPLSFLWQYPFLPPYLQSGLLADMHAVGQNSKIIKVASGGLDEGFLGENVADPRTVNRMKKALGRFSENGDGALVGEGGEFETLVVDGPSLLWKKGLQVQGEGEVVRQEGGTATWKAAMKLVEKDSDTITLQDLRKPPTFDTEFGRILRSQLQIPGATSLSERQSRPITLPLSRHFQHGRAVILSNITGKPHPDSSLARMSQSNIRLQLSNILFRLTKLLECYGMTANSITHCTLLLRDMKDFASINSLYAKFFDFTNPPSRVTVAVGDTLPAGLDVMLTAIVHSSDQPASRTGLHVQSQSYWAPANIGPYSQAISVPLGEGREVHIAGQIPLDPASMILYTEHGFRGEALLSLQHLSRIGRTQNVKWWNAGVAMIPTNVDARAQEECVTVAQAVWKAVHELPSDAENEDEEEVLDAWDRKNFSKAFDDTVARSSIPDYGVFEQQAQHGVKLRAPPCIVVEVDALPRYASIEWACTGLDVGALEQFCDGESPARDFVVRDLQKTFEYRVVEIPDEEVDTAQLLSQMQYGTLYASARFDWTDSTWFKRGIAWVPCKRVWGEQGREIKGVIVGRS
ncbi:hypothetical protein SLS60_009454 [Paraconiothyrium brasiliense]|uniref:Diphthine--ammonia ligase n=1 Tax=Paraconiothyrium brasiliense TaxID=300254 RepID=A0ABR3QUB7_9PLEO